jgi:transposase
MGLTREQKRFWAKVEKTETCWLWMGAKSANGYGTVRFNGKLQKAHRVAWQLRHGPIPSTEHVWERLELFHTCGVRSCVRPDHMGLVPRGFSAVGRPQNVRRSRARPRKLTAEQVVSIRELAPTHRYTQIAKMFGVSSSTVSSIARRMTWTDLPRAHEPEAPRRTRWDAHIPPLLLHAMRLRDQAARTIPAIGMAVWEEE